MSGSARHVNRSGRAQSETVGIVLVFGLVILGASAVVVLGTSALDDSEEQLSTQRAENALTQLDSQAALVALGNTELQSVSFARREGGQFGVTPGKGWMNVSIVNTGSGTSTDLVNQSLGAVTYDNGNDVIAYQGGGVWRSSGSGSVMISPPEFHFRNGTLTLPIINVTGDRSLDGGASIHHTETIERYPITNNPSRQNPLDEHRVRITVRSDYYEAWGRYFEQRTDGVVEYDHGDQKVFLELVSPFGKKSVESAIAGLGSGGSFTLHGSAANTCHGGHVTDSYDSSVAGYCSGSTGEAGDIVYAGNIDISSGTGSDDIRGDLVGGKDVNVGHGMGQPSVTGHINHTDSCLDSVSDCQSVADESVTEISGVESSPPINFHIQTKRNEVSASNNNSATANVSGNEIQYAAAGPTDHATLHSGAYYLDKIDFSGGDTLTFDTTDGEITLVVEKFIHVGSNRIDVKGENATNIYIAGNHGGSWDLDIGKGEITVPGDNATRVRVFGRSDFQMRMEGSGGSNEAEFVGLVYAPPGDSGTSYLEMNHAELFGGVINADTDVGNNGGGGSLHYDEALSGNQIISRDAKVVKVTYLHVTVNRVEFSNP